MAASISAVTPFSSVMLASDVVKLLIQHSADINVSDKNGMAALMSGAMKRHTDVVKLITYPV